MKRAKIIGVPAGHEAVPASETAPVGSEIAPSTANAEVERLYTPVAETSPRYEEAVSRDEVLIENERTFGEEMEPLDDPNFVAAMEKRNIDPEKVDGKKRESYYKAFQRIDDISKQLHTLYDGKFFGGVSKSEFTSAVKEHLEQQAFTEPNKVRNLHTKVADFAEIPERIAEKEKLMASRKGDHEKVSQKLKKAEAKQKDLEGKKDEEIIKNDQVGPSWSKRLFGWGKSINEHVIREKYESKITKAEKKVEELKKGTKVYEDIVKEVRQMKDSLSQTRADIFKREFGPLKAAVEVVKDKAQKKVQALVGEGRSGIGKAKEFIVRLKEFGADGIMEEADLEKMQKDLDQAIEESIKEGIERKIGTLVKENGAFSKLEKSILELASGSGKEYDNVKTFLIQTLEGSMTSAPQYKKFYVNAILEKLRDDTYREEIN